jgi:nucleoside-diphosphate-sugar epimerase
VKILITGSQGYVGSAFVEHARKVLKGFLIDGIDLGLFQNLNHYVTESYDIYLNSIQFKDLREIQVKDLSGYDAIIHLAAISNDPIGEKFSKITNEINFQTTVELAKKAKTAEINKFIFASSASVYGFSENICFENSPTNPLSAYAKSKLVSEIELEKLSDKNFQVTALRFATAAGWSPRLRSDIALNDFVIQAVVKKEIKLNSLGESYRPFVSVKDMAKAIEFSLSGRRDILNAFEVFNVGSNDWNFKIIELAKIVSKSIANSKITIDHNSTNDTRSYNLNFDKYSSTAGEYKVTEKIENTILELEINITRILNVGDKQFFDHIVRLQSIERLVRDEIIDEDLKIL